MTVSPTRLVLFLLLWMVALALILGLILTESPEPGPSVPRRTSPGARSLPAYPPTQGGYMYVRTLAGLI